MRISFVFVSICFCLLSCSNSSREKKEEARKIHQAAMELYSYAQLNAALTDEVIQQVIILLDGSIVLDPEYAPAYTFKANLLEKQNKDDEAMAVINSGVQIIGEENVDLLTSRAGLYDKEKNYELADSDLTKLLTIFDKILEKDPNSFYALSNRAVIIALTKDIPTGLTELEKIPEDQLNKQDQFQLRFLKRTLNESTREEIFQKIRM